MMDREAGSQGYARFSRWSEPARPLSPSDHQGAQ